MPSQAGPLSSSRRNIICSLRETLLSMEVLALPRMEGMFILNTDASNVEVGEILSQMQDGRLRPIAFASKHIIAAQWEYCTTRKELLAVVTFTCQFQHYLLGHHFLIRMDHSSLAWLMRFKDTEGQLARWLEELAQYDMQIICRKGKEHDNANALSQIPDPLFYCDCKRGGAEVDSLPCGGCQQCTWVQAPWARFEEDVDDVVPLAALSPEIPGVSVCADDGDSHRAKTTTAKGEAQLSLLKAPKLEEAAVLVSHKGGATQ